MDLTEGCSYEVYSRKTGFKIILKYSSGWFRYKGIRCLDPDILPNFVKVHRYDITSKLTGEKA